MSEFSRRSAQAIAALARLPYCRSIVMQTSVAKETFAFLTYLQRDMFYSAPE
jgi:hypothetical protein